jgi:hypothetical protein
MLIRDSWAWGDDLEPFADDFKKKFFEHLARISTDNR